MGKYRSIMRHWTVSLGYTNKRRKTVQFTQQAYTTGRELFIQKAFVATRANYINSLDKVSL